MTERKAEKEMVGIFFNTISMFTMKYLYKLILNANGTICFMFMSPDRYDIVKLTVTIIIIHSNLSHFHSRSSKADFLRQCVKLSPCHIKAGIPSHTDTDV